MRLGDPKVEELHEEVVLRLALAQEDVVGLDVAMEKPRGMRLGQRLRDLRDDGDDGDGVERATRGDLGGEVPALEVLHDDERETVGGDAVVEGLDDVRALHLRSRFGLALEPRPCARARVEPDEHELHDDARVERGVIGDPHGPHAAGAELAHQAHARRHLHAGRERGARLIHVPECSRNL